MSVDADSPWAINKRAQKLEGARLNSVPCVEPHFTRIFLFENKVKLEKTLRQETDQVFLKVELCIFVTKPKMANHKAGMGCKIIRICRLNLISACLNVSSQEYSNAKI